MTYLYSPADSRVWGLRDYYLIGGALQPSDIYTVRVREHWRRKRGTARAAPRPPPPAVIVPAPTRGRSRKRAIAIPGRVLRSRTVPALPALPAPPGAVVPAAPVQPAVVVSGPKRRRLG